MTKKALTDAERIAQLEHDVALLKLVAVNLLQADLSTIEFAADASTGDRAGARDALNEFSSIRTKIISELGIMND